MCKVNEYINRSLSIKNYVRESLIRHLKMEIKPHNKNINHQQRMTIENGQPGFQYKYRFWHPGSSRLAFKLGLRI